MLGRIATEKEIAIYNAVEKALEDDERWEKVVEATGDYVCAYEPHERKRAYRRLYSIAKRLGFTVEQMEIWYCID